MAETHEVISQIKLKGSVRKQMFDEKGVLIYDHTDHNLVVNTGLSYIATWLTASTQSGPFMSYVGIGTGSSGPFATDTALGSEFSGGGYSRQVGVLSSPVSPLYTWQNVSTFGPGNGTGAITEAGLFNVSTSGTMFARQVFATINKASGNTLIITWQVSFAS
jgi:hypothetical protein